MSKYDECSDRRNMTMHACLVLLVHILSRTLKPPTSAMLGGFPKQKEALREAVTRSRDIAGVIAR